MYLIGLDGSKPELASQIPRSTLDLPQWWDAWMVRVSKQVETGSRADESERRTHKTDHRNVADPNRSPAATGQLRRSPAGISCINVALNIDP